MMVREDTFITQGEFAIGRQSGTRISTILGSCVAVCLWDPETKVGGMNHILLPSGQRGPMGALRFGACDMERLVNGLLKAGAIRGNLKAKAFGGAKIVTGLSDVGERNASFVRDFLAAEGIDRVGESLGGTQARHIRFWPDTGRVTQRFVVEPTVDDHVDSGPRNANDVELFG